MKRRDFFKAVTGFVAGVFAAFVPKAKAEIPKTVEMAFSYTFDFDGKTDPKLANIDPNSEWAKECRKGLTLDGDGRWTHIVFNSPDPTSFELYLDGKRINNKGDSPYVEEWGTGKKYYLDEKTRT